MNRVWILYKIGAMEMQEVAARAARYHKTTQAMVTDGLREAILTGALRAGRQLKQEEIAEQFGVSRIPVREALRQLEGEGLVVFYPRRGAVVAELSSQEVQETCEMRVALETLALRLAMPDLTQQDLQRAGEVLDHIDRQEDLIGQWSELNWRFHAVLYAPSNRPRLLGVIKQLHAKCDRYLRLHFSAMDYREKGQSEHRQILDRCEQRDLEGAVRLLTEHIDTVSRMLTAYLEDGDPEASARQARELIDQSLTGGTNAVL